MPVTTAQFEVFQLLQIDRSVVAARATAGEDEVVFFFDRHVQGYPLLLPLHGEVGRIQRQEQVTFLYDQAIGQIAGGRLSGCGYGQLQFPGSFNKPVCQYRDRKSLPSGGYDLHFDAGSLTDRTCGVTAHHLFLVYRGMALAPPEVQKCNQPTTDEKKTHGQRVFMAIKLRSY